MQHGLRRHVRHAAHHGTCRSCGDRPALAQIGGRITALRDHDLCRQCWQSSMDRIRAEQAPSRAALEAVGTVEAA